VKSAPSRPPRTARWTDAPEDAPEDGAAFGLFAGSAFTLGTGRSAAGSALPQALWLFRDETIALPRPGQPVAGFGRGRAAFDDLGDWFAGLGDAIPRDLPPLVWAAAPELRSGCTLAADGASMRCGEVSVPVRWVAKIAANRAFADGASIAYLARRRLRVRGTTCADAFEIRTAWPQDWRLPQSFEPNAQGVDDDVRAAWRALVREAPRGGATSPFAASRLWSRVPSAAPPGAPVLAFLVNGAQGEDDEAHAGHFAVVTGRIGADGGIGDWLVNDFYTLDSESEKGILAAPVPLDNYLADLNAGQAWYRPSVMLVAVLRRPDAADLVQSALGRIYNQFYRRQLVYYHPDVNCTSISVDTLRTLGLDVGRRRAEHPLLAAAGFPLLVARERSLAKAKQWCDYLCADPTRLLPAVALEEILAVLRSCTGGTDAAPRGRLAALLARDLDALIGVRLPQIPSSRPWGDAPVASLAEYAARLPRPPAQPVVVPVPARPFPQDLRDPDLLPPPLSRSDVVAAGWGIVSLVGLPAVARALWRRLRAQRRARL
jgi:hypothetical protein